jgi:transcription antitermination factor NusG
MVWFVATVAPGDERKARDRIIWHGYPAYVPMVHRVRKVSRYCNRRRTIPVPLLPRYVFIEGPDVPWLTLERMGMVNGYLIMAGCPARIPQDAIDWLTANDGFVIDPHTQSVRAIGVGDLARHTFGPMVGQTAKVVSIHKQKARLLGKVFNTERIYEAPLAQMEVAC